MAFEHACFISYKHPPPVADGTRHSHAWELFVDTIREMLVNELTVKREVYYDVVLRRNPGGLFPQELSRNLCRSVCMVAILQPEYLESAWCRAEWQAMERLEKARGNAAAPGIIIPIWYRGGTEVRDFAGTRQVVDLRGVATRRQLRENVSNVRTLQGIAGRIDGFVRSVSDPGADCGTWSIDVGAERQVATVQDPSALHHVSL